MADGADLHFPWKAMEALLKEELGERAVRRGMKKAMAQTGDAYEAEAVKLAPHKTGYLENSSTVKTGATGDGVRTVISFGANYAAQAHELRPDQRGPQTRAKPGTKFGDPGPKYLERVLRGMNFEALIGEALTKLLERAAARSRRRTK